MSGKLFTGVSMFAAWLVAFPGFAQTADSHEGLGKPLFSPAEGVKAQIAQSPVSRKAPDQMPLVHIRSQQSTAAQKESGSMQKSDLPLPNPSAVTYPGMTRYVDLKGFFSVLMRGTPDKNSQFELVDNTKYSSVSETDKKGMWSVNYADVQGMGTPPYDSNKQSAVIQQQTNAYIGRIGGKMNSLKAHAKFGYQFRDIRGTTYGPESSAKFRLNAYLSGNRMFIVSVEGAEDFVNSPQADAFLSSFEVPGATAVPKLNQP